MLERSGKVDADEEQVDDAGLRFQFWQHEGQDSKRPDDGATQSASNGNSFLDRNGEAPAKKMLKVS